MVCDIETERHTITCREKSPVWCIWGYDTRITCSFEGKWSSLEGIQGPIFPLQTHHHMSYTITRRTHLMSHTISRIMCVSHVCHAPFHLSYTAHTITFSMYVAHVVVFCIFHIQTSLYNPHTVTSLYIPHTSTSTYIPHKFVWSVYKTHTVTTDAVGGI